MSGINSGNFNNNNDAFKTQNIPSPDSSSIMINKEIDVLGGAINWFKQIYMGGAINAAYEWYKKNERYIWDNLSSGYDYFKMKMKDGMAQYLME